MFTGRNRYSNPIAKPIKFDRISIRQEHFSGHRLKFFRTFESQIEPVGNLTWNDQAPVEACIHQQLSRRDEPIPSSITGSSLRLK